MRSRTKLKRLKARAERATFGRACPETARVHELGVPDSGTHVVDLDFASGGFLGTFYTRLDWLVDGQVVEALRF